MDYQSNAKKAKKPSETPVKSIEKVVVGEVVVQKKPIGRKIKDIFIEADLRTVIGFVMTEVLIPSARNMIVDASTKGIERLMYGESAIKRRNFGAGPRITYSNPLHRTDYREAISRSSGVQPARLSRRARNDFVLSSREEAAVVLERMNDIIDQFEVASVADLNDLVGFPTTHVDNKWGWLYLGDVQIRQVREGYLIDFPPPEPIG